MENDSAIFCERSLWTSNLRCTDLQLLLYAQRLDYDNEVVGVHGGGPKCAHVKDA